LVTKDMVKATLLTKIMINIWASLSMARSRSKDKSSIMMVPSLKEASTEVSSKAKDSSSTQITRSLKGSGYMASSNKMFKIIIKSI